MRSEEGFLRPLSASSGFRLHAVLLAAAATRFFPGRVSLNFKLGFVKGHWCRIVKKCTYVYEDDFFSRHNVLSKYFHKN